MIVLLKKLYSRLVSIISHLNKSKAASKGIAYLLSFPDNDAGLIEAIQKDFPEEELTIYYKKNCTAEAKRYRTIGIKTIPIDQTLIFFLRIVPQLTKAKVIICDNYFPFLGDLKLSHSTMVYQLWHANGALKTFGFQDQKTAQRPASEQARFRRVYQQFKQILVGSPQMADIFKVSYGLSDEHILPIGLPRTDIYFSAAYQETARQKFATAFPEAKDKKVVLYVPTYRDQGKFELLDLTSLAAELGHEYFLLGKLHPHSAAVFDSSLTDLRGLTLAEILSQVQVLITDYSSVPFEYSLANPAGRIMFHAPDYENYHQTTGLQPFYKDLLNKYGTTSTSQLVQQVNDGEGLSATALNQTWNTYNDGRVTPRFLESIKQHLVS